MSKFKKLALASTVCSAFAVAPAVHATLFTLSDHDSSVKINDASQAGMFNWKIDGINHLFQQWFWFRVGKIGGEHSLDTLPRNFERATDTNGDGSKDNLSVEFQGRGFRIDLSYQLTGGSAGSGTGDIGESIAIYNETHGVLDFHFFQYSDFDLNGTAAGDTVQITGGVGLHNVGANTADQSKGAFVLAETVATPKPSHHAVGLFPDILNSLNDANPTTLNDSNGPLTGDATWAFQWDRTIAGCQTVKGKRVCGSLLISKDKNISSVEVPEPGLLSLLGLGLLGVGVSAATRRRARR